MNSLTRYWIVFERSATPTPLNLGCGVTAYDRHDAEELVRERAFAGRPIPKIVQVLENVDVSTLDQRHVAPNLGDVTVRGVWFPLGL